MGSLRKSHHNLRPITAPLAALTLLLTTPIAAAQSLCAPNETTLFTCPIGQKLVSICNAAGKPTYNYGAPGKVEITSQQLFTANHPYSGGGETQITFKNKTYTYTVFDKTTRTSFAPNGQNDPDFTSGLLVQNNGKTLSTKQCATDATIPATATNLLPPGPFIEH